MKPSEGTWKRRRVITYDVVPNSEPRMLTVKLECGHIILRRNISMSATKVCEECRPRSLASLQEPGNAAREPPAPEKT